MKKHDISTIDDLQQYLDGMSYIEKEMDGYPYYIFLDGTVAIEDSNLASIIASDNITMMWERINSGDPVSNYLHVLDQVSTIYDIDSLIQNALGDDIADNYKFHEEFVVIEHNPYRIDSVELLVPSATNQSIFDDEILYVDMTDYMDKYINNGLLFLYHGEDINTDEEHSISYLLEAIYNLAGKDSEYRRMMCNFASIKDTVDGFVYSSKSVPEHYDKFMDEDGKPSLLMKEFDDSDRNWWMGLHLISNLEDPVLNKWFIDTYHNTWYPLDQQVTVTVPTFSSQKLELRGNNHYREICDILDAETLIRDYVGVLQENGKWNRSKIKYNMYFDLDDFYETLLGRAKKVLQPYIDNHPASLVWDLNDGLVIGEISIDDDHLFDNEQERLMKDTNYLLNNLFPMFLEWIAVEEPTKKEQIGFFFVARP